MWDAFVRGVEKFLEGGRLVLEDIRSIDIPRMYEQIRSGDFDWSTVIIASTVTILAGLVVYAQFTPDHYDEQMGDRLNAALGIESEPKNQKDAPPVPPPTEVVALRVYPIKSCRGFEVDSSMLQKSGLLLDRNWMFVDKAKMEFLTIRSDSNMTLIDTTVVEQVEGKKAQQFLKINIHGTDKVVTVPAFPSKEWLSDNTTLQTVNIWGSDTDGYVYSDEINSVFRDFFKKDVALVLKGPKARVVGINGGQEMYGKDTPHHFADVMSLQVASEASIKDLNKRLKLKGNNALTIERFRPNIIVRGRDSHPWEEDTWKRIRISTRMDEEQLLYKLDLDVVARCARCQVPNVNPDTAEKHPKQPWEELMKFRRVDQGGVAKYKPCFGMMCIPKNEGYVARGAKFEVLETTDKHVYNEAKFEDL